MLSASPGGEVRRMIEQSLKEAMDQTGLQPAGGAATVIEQVVVVGSRNVQEVVEEMSKESFQVSMGWLMRRRLKMCFYCSRGGGMERISSQRGFQPSR